MANGANVERLKTRRKDIADAEAAGEGDAVEGFMPQEQSEFESREDYRGYKMPKGMSLPQRRAYKKAIDERENFRSKAARQLPRKVEDFKEDYIKGPVRRAKEVGKEMFKEAEVLPGMAKGVGEFAVDAALTVPRAKAAMYTDPEGSKEFMKAVASGDREAVRKFATGASESMVEPFATGGDAILALDAAERGDSAEAALYGASVLLPFVSVGWLKSAMKAGEVPPEAAKKIADLEKRYEAGDVTDEMQIRRELAHIEDDHMVEYAKGRPIEDPLQKGGSQPSPYDDPDAAYEFDREPPGYMAMSRSNQPMSRFSEGHESFIHDLRTDMTEDTNFGELSSRFYDALLDIDKREDLLRSTGKDARGRQLDGIEISNEYETLSKERHSLANEYYVGKAEREAELRYEGSYVPPGSKTTLAGEPVGPPSGGGTPGGPPRPGPAKIQRMDESGLYPGGQEYKLFSPRTDSIYKGGNVIQTSAYGPSDLRIGDMFETKYHDGRPAIGVMKADGVDLFPPDGQDARRLSDIVKKRHGKPQLAFPDAAGEIQYYEDQYSMGKRGSDEFDLERGGTPGGGGGSDPELGFGASEVPGETAAREYYENQPRPRDADYRDPTDAELREMFEQQPHMFGRKTPGGGGFKDQADQLIRELDELSFSGMQRSGLDMQPQSVLRKRLDDLRDRIEQAPPEVREEIFRRARMTSQGINPAPFTETIGQLRLADDIRGGNPLVGKPPGGGRVSEFTEDDGIDKYKQLVMSFADEGRPFSFTEVFTDPSQPFDQDLYKAVDELVAEGRISGPSPFDDNVYDEFGRTLNHNTMVYTKTPGGGGVDAFKKDQADRQEYFLSQGLGRREPELSSPKFGLSNQGHHNVVEDLGPLLPEDKDLLDTFEGKYNLSETELRQLRDEYVAYGYDEFPSRSQRGFKEIDIPDDLPGGGRSVDDIEGPSEAEIQQMVETSKFGDPEELEMLKEDMRRMAELEQGAQIESGRVRKSRTPGAPGASGKIPEGTSRAERKGTVRERPKKK